jgi:ATP-dependent exoDNAse (exonuclease V) beta subunit
MVHVRDLLRIDTQDSLERGSVVHAWFEQVDWSDQPLPPDSELLEVARRVAPFSDSARLNNLIADFRKWCAQPALVDVLARSRYAQGEVELERELGFIHRFGDVLLEGAIDRLVISYEGGVPVCAEVIDFKTDRVGPTGRGIGELKKHYAPQLAAYAAAVAGMYRLPATACAATLVFLEAGRAETLLPVELVPAGVGNDSQSLQQSLFD